MSFILAIDQGTSSTKSIIFDEKGQPVCRGVEPLKSHFLEGGLVEQDPEEIYQNVLASVSQCLQAFKQKGGDATQIKSCGISNQRETFLLWDESGQPLHNAVVWQCKRSVSTCKELQQRGIEQKLNERTGLIIDPYFSGSKVIWLFENVESIRKAIDSGKAFFGNIDTWLLYKMTNGQSYFTDYTNASRTMFFNLKDLNWDQELLADFNLEKLNLPEAKPSDFTFGETDLGGLIPHAITISSMIGDSHAAAFGEGCFESGSAKATLGTGSSILMNVGAEPKQSKAGMVTTICWSMADRVDFALEGIIVSAGATVEWVKNQLGLFKETSELEGICLSVSDNGGVYIVPAFSGLGAPHWQMARKGSIEGLTFDSSKNHVIRAAVESVAYQIKDVIEAMEQDAGTPLAELKVDGGITNNKMLVQFLSDLLERKVTKIGTADVSAMGAAYLAGLSSGVYQSLDQLKTFNLDASTTEPGEGKALVKKWYKGWQEALAK